jgi:hypothetical protein
MAVTWRYKDVDYSSLEEAQQACLVFRAELDNNPSKWAKVKEVSGSSESGWVVPITSLSDNEIKNLNPEKHYSVSSPITGESLCGLTAEAAAVKVAEYRTAYAVYWNADSILRRDYSGENPSFEPLPTTLDMSGYV